MVKMMLQMAYFLSMEFFCALTFKNKSKLSFVVMCKLLTKTTCTCFMPTKFRIFGRDCMSEAERSPPQHVGRWTERKCENEPGMILTFCSMIIWLWKLRHVGMKNTSTLDPGFNFFSAHIFKWTWRFQLNPYWILAHLLKPTHTWARPVAVP